MCLVKRGMCLNRNKKKTAKNYQIKFTKKIYFNLKEKVIKHTLLIAILRHYKLLSISISKHCTQGLTSILLVFPRHLGRQILTTFFHVFCFVSELASWAVLRLTRTHCVTQVGLKLAIILLSQALEFWNYNEYTGFSLLHDEEIKRPPATTFPLFL